jgi:hypothetical protein
MAAPLDPKLADLLIRLLQLDGGNYDTFHPYFSGDSEGEAELIGHDGERVPEGPIKELDRLGLIDMLPEPGKRLGTFTITTEGRSLGGQLASAGDGAVDLSWPAVESILRQIHNVWKREGAPELGIGGDAIQAQIEPPMETAQLVVILQELTRDEWLDTRSGWGPPLPMAVRPSSRTIARFEGWPTQDPRIAGEQFVALLEERIDAEPDAEKQSKLRAALATGGTALKDLSVEVAAAIVARQVGGN